MCEYGLTDANKVLPKTIRSYVDAFSEHVPCQKTSIAPNKAQHHSLDIPREPGPENQIAGTLFEYPWSAVIYPKVKDDQVRLP